MLLTGPILAKPEGFDPDAYLRDKTAAFDPDAYLREKRVSDMAAGMGAGESLGRGAAQGATLGHGDEMAASFMAGQKQLERMPELKGVPDADLYALAMADRNDYEQPRNDIREKNEAARRANPKTYLAGELAGGVVPTAAATLATGGAGALPMAVAQGAAQGAGYSNADTPGGVAGDSALGGLTGAVGHQTGQVLGRSLGGLADLAKSKSAAAAGRAATQAGEESRTALGRLSSKYGSEVQKGSRQVENMMRLYEKMTPQQQALYAELEKTGVVPALQQQVAQSTLEAMPGQAATIAERKAAMEAAQQALPQTIAARTAELSKPQFLKDAASFAKSYGEPVAAAVLAPAGLKVPAATLFGRTRAGKALMSRVNRPGNQMAIWDTVEGAANAPMGGGDVGQFLREAIRAAAIQQSVRQMAQ